MYELDSELIEVFQTALTTGRLSAAEIDSIIISLESILLFSDSLEEDDG